MTWRRDNMELESRNDIGIKDAMTYNVITAKSDTTISQIASMMAKHDISSVVIQDEMVKGIVTSNNIISKVVSKNIPPKDVTADMLMSDYVSIDINSSLTDASKLMIQNNCKLLLVMDNDDLKGIISQTDIVAVSPELIEIFVDEINIDDSAYNDGNYNVDYDENLDEGVCEKCGVYDQLTASNGQYLCSDCIEDSIEE